MEGETEQFPLSDESMQLWFSIVVSTRSKKPQGVKSICEFHNNTVFRIPTT